MTQQELIERVAHELADLPELRALFVGGSYGWLYVGSFAVGIGATAIALLFPPFPSRQRAAAAQPA